MTERPAHGYSAMAEHSLKLISVPDITIANLPNELLEHIFMFNSLQNFQHLHDPARTIRQTSQVCQRWRIIALDTPTLWAHIVDLENNSRWTEIVLDRARSASVDLILPSMTKDLLDKNWAPTMLRKTLSLEMIDLITNRSPKVWHSLWFFFEGEVLDKCLAKTRSILLSVSSWHWSLFLCPAVTGYLPKLESLSIVTLADESGIFGDKGQLTDGSPWNLRSLNLRKCSIHFEGLSLPCLEELTIHHLPPEQALLPVIWLGILENLPKLKRLELVNVTANIRWMIPGGNEEFSHLSRAVQLPDMQWLRLSLPLPHCVNILENLVIPASCKLDLTTDRFSLLREEFYCLLDIIEGKFSTTGDAPLGKALRLSISPDRFIAHVFDEKDGYEKKGPCPLFYLSVTWEMTSDGPDVNPFTVLGAMTSALRKLCVPATMLRIDLDVAAEPNEWMGVLPRLFSNFENLKHLHHVSPSTLRFLLSCFEFLLSQRNRTPVGNDSEADCRKLLPLINSISFQDVNFASFYPSYPNLLKTLHDFVTMRLADPDVSPIARLTFANCRGMSQNGINGLTNVGVQLYLDESTSDNY